MPLVKHKLQNSDIFCFADYPYHPVCIDLLILQPKSNDKDINNWYNHTFRFILLLIIYMKRSYFLKGDQFYLCIYYCFLSKSVFTIKCKIV